LTKVLSKHSFTSGFNFETDSFHVQGGGPQVTFGVAQTANPEAPAFTGNAMASLIWVQDWAIKSKLALLFAELVVCGLILAALHDQIIVPCRRWPMWSALCGKRTIPFACGWRFPTTLLASSLSKSTCWPICWQHIALAIEATALLQRVVEEVDIPLFAFDPSETLRLVNSAGERFFSRHPRACWAGRPRTWV
jgi:hypothetical protein